MIAVVLARLLSRGLLQVLALPAIAVIGVGVLIGRAAWRAGASRCTVWRLVRPFSQAGSWLLGPVAWLIKRGLGR